MMWQTFRRRMLADGTEATLTSFPDGSARLDLILPDGTTQTILQSVPRHNELRKLGFLE